MDSQQWSDMDHATRCGARSVRIGLLRKLKAKLRDYDWYGLGGTTFRIEP